MRFFRCPECGRVMYVSRTQEIFSMHLFGRLVYRKCNGCGKRHWLKKIINKSKEN